MQHRLAFLFVAMLGCGGGQLTGGPGDVDGAPGHTPDAHIGPGQPDAAGVPDGGPAPPGGCKRGVAYNRENGADLPAIRQGIGWWYNWSPTPGDGTDALSAA